MSRRNRRWGHPVVAPGLVGILALTSALLNTRFDSPPRYDGAGYAVLGLALASGRGYHEISHPEAPPHTHFPPGYPMVLATLFRGCGPSVAAAHAFSVLGTTAAAVVAWCWFRRLYGPGTAMLLGMALGVNWAWGRLGGAIQSEPLYLALSLSALLASSGARGRGTAGGIVAGLLLGACVLTRHVGICLVLAVVVDLLLRRRPGLALAAGSTAIACVVPWIGWLLRARRGSQAELLQGEQALSTAAHQALFYTRRIPDQVLGPVVEIATVYSTRPVPAMLATAGSVVLTGIVIAGWGRTLRTPRRRLAGLAAFSTMALLLVWPFTEAGRFLVPLVPMILVGGVEGLAPLLRLVKLRRPRRWAAGMMLAASLPYAVYAVATGRAEAARRTHSTFDAACAWIALQTDEAGPILTHYPADAFWQTRRRALEVLPPGDPRSIGSTIDRFGVAYLLVDEKPFTNAPPDPLARFVADDPQRVRLVWGKPGEVAVYRVVPAGTR